MRKSKQKERLAKKWREKRRARRASGKDDSGISFTEIVNPFKGVDHERVVKAFTEAGERCEKEFREVLEQTLEIIGEHEPLHLLSVLSVYGLFRGMDEDGKVTKEPEKHIQQHHVELVQALALSLAVEQKMRMPALPDRVQKIWDYLISLSNLFNQKRWADAQNAKTEEEKSLALVQEHLRLHTQAVRNWGYFKRVVNTIGRLYKPLNSVYKKQIGLEATAIINAFEYLVFHGEEEVNRWSSRLRPVLQARTIKEAAEKYYAGFPDLKGSPDDLAKLVEENGGGIEGMFSLAMTHSSLRLVDIFTFTTNELAKTLDVCKEGLERVFGRLSFKLGELAGGNVEHFFMGNPIWTKPLIRLGDGEFFCAVPQVFFSFCFQTLDSLIDESEGAKIACSKRRSEFLEDEIVALVEAAFPDGELTRHFIWNDGEAEYETDILLKCDSYLIVIEAKSGSITWPALRGAAKRIKRHVKELILEPAMQSQRLCDKVAAIKAGGLDDNSFRDRFPFRLDEIHRVIRLSITLEDFATIQTNIPALEKTGWLKDESPLPPTLLLADFEIILDVLPSISEKIHYLVQRAELQGKLNFMGDELDLLGLYLETGLNIKGCDFDNRRLLLTGISKSIDDYYVPQDCGIARKKPVIKTTQWWSDIRMRLEKNRPHRWLEAAVMLLNVHPDEQRKLEQKFNKETVRNVKKNWRRPGNINSMCLYPTKEKDGAIGLLAFREEQREKRHDLMQNLADNMLSKSQAERCLILGVNIDRNEYPYSILGVFDK